METEGRGKVKWKGREKTVRSEEEVNEIKKGRKGRKGKRKRRRRREGTKEGKE